MYFRVKQVEIRSPGVRPRVLLDGVDPQDWVESVVPLPDGFEELITQNWTLWAQVVCGGEDEQKAPKFKKREKTDPLDKKELTGPEPGQVIYINDFKFKSPVLGSR